MWRDIWSIKHIFMISNMIVIIRFITAHGIITGSLSPAVLWASYTEYRHHSPGVFDHGLRVLLTKVHCALDNYLAYLTMLWECWSLKYTAYWTITWRIWPWSESADHWSTLRIGGVKLQGDLRTKQRPGQPETGTYTSRWTDWMGTGETRGCVKVAKLLSHITCKFWLYGRRS